MPFLVKRSESPEQTAIRSPPKIQINTLRDGATHEYDPDVDPGYTRPKQLTTPAFPIEPNETLELTSPYGGPVQVHFDINDVDVSFVFENVGEHPYWRGYRI
jgi:hypothetical protein